MRRLVACSCELTRFCHEVAGLDAKLAVLLVQLPPSLEFDAAIAAAFFTALAKRTEAVLECEPRHASWFDARAADSLAERRVARVAADPPRDARDGEPGGWRGRAYYRMHGAPRIYYSDYDAAALRSLNDKLNTQQAVGHSTWYMFDNTAAFAAVGNALALRALELS